MGDIPLPVDAGGLIKRADPDNAARAKVKDRPTPAVKRVERRMEEDQVQTPAGKNRLRVQRWREKLKADPVRYAAYLEKERERKRT